MIVAPVATCAGLGVLVRERSGVCTVTLALAVFVTMELAAWAEAVPVITLPLLVPELTLKTKANVVVALFA